MVSFEIHKNMETIPYCLVLIIELWFSLQLVIVKSVWEWRCLSAKANILYQS